jgi:hypothetical protein
MKFNQDDNCEGFSRHKMLERMTWAGTGVLAIIDTPMQG